MSDGRSAGAASSDREQQQLYEDLTAFDAMRREGSFDLMRCLLDQVLSAGSPAQTASAPPEAGDSLALVDPDEFERWLEASAVATRLDDVFISELRSLDRHGGGRPGDESAASIEVPFSPHQFTAVLKDLAARLGFAGPSRKVLFATADAARQGERSEGAVGIEIRRAQP